MRFATWAENRNLLFCNTYWLEFMQKLALNQTTGIYGFDQAVPEAKNDFESGKIQYHLGNFSEAISCITKDIQQRGESETKLFWLAISYMRQAEAENCL